MNQTINYMTQDGWWDTDIGVLHNLVKDFKLNVFVFNDSYVKKKYETKENLGFNRFEEFNLKFRDRNPLKLFETLKAWYKFNKSSHRKNTTNFYVIARNPYLILLNLLFTSSKNTIIGIHNFIEHSDAKNNFENVIISRLIYKKFKHYCFFSEVQYNEFVKYYPNKKAFYINMPLKDFGKPIEQRHDEKITYLLFGSIRGYKRIDWYIKAANSVESKNVRFIIAGNKNDWDSYETLIKDKSRFDLHLKFIANKEIPNFFCNADFLVLPYDYATQSGPSLIAINYGLPIIASDVEAFKKIIKNGFNGYLFHVNDLDGLKAIFNQTSKMSREEIQELKNNQKKARDEYNHNVIINEKFQNYIKEFM